MDLATDGSCGEAVEKLGRHHPGVEMGRTTALRLLHEHGANARRFIDLKAGGGPQRGGVRELRQAWEASGDAPDTRQDDPRLAAGYSERNGDAVAYGEYRERGWNTASSEIESCHGTIAQPRLKIGGAWWHPDGVDDILALRTLRADGWWDEYWTEQRRKRRTRAATFAESRPALAA